MEQGPIFISKTGIFFQIFKNRQLLCHIRYLIKFLVLCVFLFKSPLLRCGVKHYYCCTCYISSDVDYCIETSCLVSYLPIHSLIFFVIFCPPLSLKFSSQWRLLPEVFSLSYFKQRWRCGIVGSRTGVS